MFHITQPLGKYHLQEFLPKEIPNIPNYWIIGSSIPSPECFCLFLKQMTLDLGGCTLPNEAIWPGHPHRHQPRPRATSEKTEAALSTHAESWRSYDLFGFLFYFNLSQNESFALVFEHKLMFRACFALVHPLTSLHPWRRASWPKPTRHVSIIIVHQRRLQRVKSILSKVCLTCFSCIYGNLSACGGSIVWS